MKIIALIILFLNLIFSAPVFAAENSCKTLGDSLYDCKPFECKTPDPSNPKQFITNVIKGLNKDGECVHEQSNPDGDKLICNYSEESRKFLGLKMKKAGSDIAGLEDATEFEENLMADIFQNECEVISKNGKKVRTVEESESGDSDSMSGDSDSFGDNPAAESDGSAAETIPPGAAEPVASGHMDMEGETGLEGPEGKDIKGVEDNGDLLDSK